MKYMKYAVFWVLSCAAVVAALVLVGLVFIVQSTRDWMENDDAE